jgi:hypothetical protein
MLRVEELCVLADAATIGGAKLVLTVRLYLGLIAPSRERPSVTEDGVIILLLLPIFIAGGVPRFMKALSFFTKAKWLSPKSYLFQ